MHQPAQDATPETVAAVFADSQLTETT